MSTSRPNGLRERRVAHDCADPNSAPGQVQHYLDLWVKDGNEAFDASLRRLFTEFMPTNTDSGDVAVKVSALNAIYATQILGVTQMAEHIVGLGVDPPASTASPQTHR